MSEDSAQVEKATVTSGHPVSSFDLFSKSWEVIKNNLGVFAILSIPTLLSVAWSFSTSDTSSSASNEMPASIASAGNFVSGLSGFGLVGLAGGAFLLVALFFAIGIVIQALTVVAQLRGAQGQKLSLGGVWDEGRPYVLRLFGLSLLTGLFVAAGLILLIIPGIIIMRRYFLAPYIMIDQKLGITDSMKASAELGKPHSWSIYGVLGVTLLIAFTGVVPIIGTIASVLGGIVYSVAPALRYVELKKLSA